eukprot:3401120-Prorocentrum_lima.AAC.1
MAVCGRGELRNRRGTIVLLAARCCTVGLADTRRLPIMEISTIVAYPSSSSATISSTEGDLLRERLT